MARTADDFPRELPVGFHSQVKARSKRVRGGFERVSFASDARVVPHEMLGRRVRPSPPGGSITPGSRQLSQFVILVV